MSISLTNAFDEALAPFMVDCLNSLGLYLKFCTSLDVTESDYTSATYTLSERFEHKPLATWQTAEPEGDYLTSTNGPVVVEPLGSGTGSPVIGFVLTQGAFEEDATAWGYFDPPIDVSVPQPVAVRLKALLSDKETPAP